MDIMSYNKPMTIDEIRQRLKQLGFSEESDIIVKGDFAFFPPPRIAKNEGNFSINYVDVAYNLLSNIIIRRGTLTVDYQMFDEGEEDRPETYFGEIAVQDIFRIDG
jgi:hypothetical protein